MTHDITVIVPTYNRPRGLERAVRSVLAQEGVNVRCIVVDDGSDPPAALGIRDDRLCFTQWAAPAMDKSRVCTIARALNALRASLATPYVAFCTDSAELAPGALAALAGHLAANPGVAVAWGHIARDGQPDTGPGAGVERWGGFALENALDRGNFIDLSGSMLAAHGVPFDESPEAWPDMDWRLWKTMAARGYVFHRIPVHVATKYSGPQNMGAMLAGGASIADVVSSPRE